MLTTIKQKHVGRRALLGYAPFILALGIATTTSAAGLDNPVNDVKPAMTAEWWQWALSIPTSVHPLRTYVGTGPGQIDPSSDFCMVGQHGDLWHLGGSFIQVDLIPNGPQPLSGSAAPLPDITRTCKIPYGTAILIPVLNAECNTAEEIHLDNLKVNEPYLKKVNYLRTCARTQADAINPETVEASFGPTNGPLSRLNVKRVSTLLPFAMTYAPDHILQFGKPWVPTVNPSLAFSDGYWVLIRPPRPGEYELNTFGEAPTVPFSLRIKYILKIVGPQEQ